MVVKKYIKRGDKFFGPYYYESKRVDGKVIKVYIGGEKEYREWLARKKKNYHTNKKFLLVFLIGVLLLVNLFSFFSEIGKYRFIGLVISGNESETKEFLVGLNEERTVQSFEAKKINLEIKEPLKSLGEPVTENKNERIDFGLEEGKLRVYFDVLNYSHFVKGLAEESGLLEENYKTEKKKENKTDFSNVTLGNQSENVTLNNQTENVIPGNQSENVTDQTFSNEEVNKSLVEENNSENKNEEKSNEKNGSIEKSPGENIGKEKKFETSFTAEVISEIGDIEQFNNTEESNETNLTQPDDSEGNSFEIRKERLKKLKENLKELDEKKREIVDKEAVVEAEDFDIKVDALKINESNPEVKWGYKVRLKDLKFMGRIEITTDMQISKYNDYSLKIGKRNLLSFEDLVKAGYKVSIENPSLEIVTDVPVVNVSFENVSILNETSGVENFTETNITVPENFSENVSGNLTEGEFNLTGEENVITLNETLSNESKESNESLNKGLNESLKEGLNESEEIIVVSNESFGGNEVSNEKEKEVVNKTEELRDKEVRKEGGEKEGEGEKSGEGEKGEKFAKEKNESKEGMEKGLTGSVVKILRLTGRVVTFGGRVTGKIVGRVIGIEKNETIKDVEYGNTIKVYLERDFSDVSGNVGIGYEDVDGDGKVSVGDVVELDPTLIIIPISNAEELDENRSYIRNVYNETVEKDDRWVLINDSHFIRATFKKALGKNNDITVFAKLAGYSCVESFVENCSEVVNETTNETEKVCKNLSLEDCPDVSEGEKGKIEVYRENGTEVIATILNITKADYYKTYLDGLHGGSGLSENESVETFDLKIVGGVELYVNSSVVVNGQEVPYDVYQKKKRIDEIRRILGIG